MADTVSLTGTIGTWAAVALAILALIGIIGPLLIWQASRTERHLALNHVIDSGGYVTKGLWATSKIRLFRTIKAPILDGKPNFTGATLFSLDCANDGLKSTSLTSWVRFGLLVEAYKIKFLRGDKIKVGEGQTLLPVQRLWVFLIGLLGRYGNRTEDEAKIPVERPRAATPGSLKYGRRYSSLGRPDVRPGTANSMYGYEMRRQPTLVWGGSKLYGITGCFEKLDSEAYRFIPHDQAAIGTIPPDVLSLKHLLWLAFGAISVDENNVYSLDDVERKRKQNDQMAYQQARALRFDVADSDSDSEQGFGRKQSFIARTASSNTADFEIEKTDVRAPGRLRACGFTAFNDQLDWLRDIKQSFGGLEGTLHGLEEVEVDLEASPELNVYFSTTYIPASSSWVRLPPKRDVKETNSDPRDESFDTWVIRRADIQLLAKSLLSMAWHTEGYLLGGNRLSRCRKLLSASAIDSLRLLARIKEHPAALGLSANQTKALTEVLEPAIQKGITKGDRIASQALYDLDIVVQGLLASHELAAMVVGILVITNEEFRSLVTQSARHLDMAVASAGVVLDIPNGTLRTPSVFGISQEFGIDFATLYPNGGIPNSSIPISLSTVVLAAVKACIRSALLEATWSSKPLLDFVMDMPEVSQFE